MKNIESNLWKIFVYILTNRRHYIVLSSVFFLMQTGATEKMLGYSMSLGMLAGFVMEIPSGYFADRFGHKRTLILSKIFMLASSLFYAFTGGVVGLFFASVCISLGFSLMSGTIQAFTHETLASLKREKDYAGIMSKIKGKVSLIQVFTFALFPMIASYNIRLPFYIGIVIDLVGLRVVWQFVEPLIHKELKKVKSLWEVIKEQAGTDFYYVALFFSMVGSFMLGFSTFREPYLVSIGFIIFFIGLVPAGSRLMWWAFSYLTGWISKNIKLNQLMLFEMFLFPLLFMTIAVFPNRYYVGVVIAVCQGYMYAREPLVSQYLIEQLPDPRYKSTALSLRSQIGMLFGVIAPLALGYLVSVETVLGQYKDGVFLRGSILLVGLFISWLLWRRKRGQLS